MRFPSLAEFRRADVLLFLDVPRAKQHCDWGCSNQNWGLNALIGLDFNIVRARPVSSSFNEFWDVSVGTAYARF